MSNLPTSELDRAMARQKSYAGPCILVLLLYCVFVVPGLLANYLYLEDAKRAERLAGEALPGVEALKWMFTLAAWGIVIVVALVLCIFLGTHLGLQVGAAL